MPRDCTGVRKSLVMYSPGRLPGIQYNKLRQSVATSMQRRANMSGGAIRKKRGSARKGGLLDATTPVQRAFVPAAAPIATGAKRVSRVVEIRRREVCSVLSLNTGPFSLSSTLNSATRLIHPGNPALFPWLSNIAPCYEKYRVRSLVFHLITGAPTTASGLLHIAVDTDPSDDAPSDLGELMGNQMSASNGIWTGLQLSTSTGLLMAGLPWRFTEGKVGNEPRTTYLGQLFVAASGLDQDRQVTLEVEYCFEFCVEQRPLTGPQTLPGVAYAVANYGQPAALPLSAGAVRTVVAGQSAPLLVGGPVYYGSSPLLAYDVGAVLDGMFRHQVDTERFETTPNALLAGADLGLNAYDASGQFQGRVQGSNTFGALTSGNLSTEGAVARMAEAVSIESVRGMYPTVRYLVPWITQLVTGDYHTYSAMCCE